MASKAYNEKFTEMAKSHPLIPPQVIKELHSGARNAAISEGLKLREKPAEGDAGHEEAESTEEEALEQPESPDESEEPESEAESADDADLEEAFEKDCGFSYPQKNEKVGDKKLKMSSGEVREFGSEEKRDNFEKIAQAIKHGWKKPE